ncbi:SUKH-4 family immunity protein [Streptomyces flaveus]|uniref:SUKH-4 family immunity protein n=1 Tax=Streptomyces flaveus TaxID=66370 RepID=UPI0033318D4D
MLAQISSQDVLDTFGLTGVVYYPSSRASTLDQETFAFLSSTGLPANETFAPLADLTDHNLIFSTVPSLKAEFERYSADLPPECTEWEILGQLLYSTAAIDPTSGKIYSFPEGEEHYVPLHADVSSLTHSLIVLEKGKRELKELRDDPEYTMHTVITERMTAEISAIDETPLSTAESEWTRIFEEIAMGMWG